MAQDAALSSRPTVDDLTGDNQFAQLARKHWLGKTKQPKVQANVVKEDIWDAVEKEGFAYGPLLLLEQLQLLEKYLWPGYSEDASNYHVLLLALLVNVKRREGLPVWGESASSVCRHMQVLMLFQTLSPLMRETSPPFSAACCQ